MICDSNKGRISIDEALHYELGLLQFLWYEAMKASTSKASASKKLEDAIEDL